MAVVEKAGSVAALAVALAVSQVALGCSGPSGGGRSAKRGGDPQRTITADPDYTKACSPSGLDRSLPCIRATLAAIDRARAAEGVKAMKLPANFVDLTVPEQLLVTVDRERVDRGLPPFAGLTEPLNANARTGADRAAVPTEPGPPYSASDGEWVGAVANGLDADYLWMYDDGPGSSVPDCTAGGGKGCWADRHIVLDDLGSTTLEMGAAVNPSADNSPNDRGGPSVAVTLAARRGPPGPFVYTWAKALGDTRAGSIAPAPAQASSGPDNAASASHIPDPPRTVPPDPDYFGACGDGLDSSPPCLDAIVAAVDTARAAEGVKPIVLPGDFGRMTVPEQILVTVNLERVDRGLAAFAGLTADLDGNAQQGADIANDPPDPGPGYAVVDTIWAGGSANGLDADYGWMYDDGPDSTNLDCPPAGGSGCWGHRHAILDDFGSVGTLVMGAALSPTADTNTGDVGGTSMAATLAIVADPPSSFATTWAQASSQLPR